jgi:DNA polymerase II large subunit
LTGVYIVGVGLTSLTARIFKKHFLDIKMKNVKSYWIDLNLKKKKIEEYYRQF